MKKLKFSNTQNPCYEIEGKKIWDSRDPSVICAIVVRERPENGDSTDYILISRRGKGCPDFVGKWNLISGFLDRDENGTNACFREVWEEAGLDLKKIMETYPVLANHMEHPFYVNTEPNTANQHIGLRYGVHIRVNDMRKFMDENPLSDENSEPDEVDGYAWITMDELDDYEYAFTHKEVIKFFMNKIDNLMSYI